MSQDLSRHQQEILANQRSWESKPLLRAIYREFHLEISRWIDPQLPGRALELGSGIGSMKDILPDLVRTDLFPNPWLDLVCDAYHLPVRSGALSHIILFDVFHHLERPAAFFSEATRALSPRGRVILFEPYISGVSRLVYGPLHPEPIAWSAPIDLSSAPPERNVYYAAQGNATRLFFRAASLEWLTGWRIVHKQAFASFAYLLSGGFSKPAFYPAFFLPALQWMDRAFSRAPGLFAARAIVVLEKLP